MGSIVFAGHLECRSCLGFRQRTPAGRYPDLYANVRSNRYAHSYAHPHANEDAQRNADRVAV